jgi:hypothetical protein
MLLPIISSLAIFSSRLQFKKILPQQHGRAQLYSFGKTQPKRAARLPNYFICHWQVVFDSSTRCRSFTVQLSAFLTV